MQSPVYTFPQSTEHPAQTMKRDRITFYDPMPDRHWTLCGKCLEKRDGHWQRAVADGAITVIATRRDACIHCGR